MSMSNEECAAALEELHRQYTRSRLAWVKQFGDETGFSEWFTEQVMNAGKGNKHEG